jgi:transposase-like protein
MMNRQEKLLCVAKALATHYGVPFDIETEEEQELQAFIKGILARTNGNLKRCSCGSVLQRKYINGKTKYICKNCNKTFAIREC